MKFKKQLVLIFVIIPKANPIIALLINKIIHDGITLNKLKDDIANKQ